MTRIAVLEVGGTHASSGWVEPATWAVEPGGRCALRADGSADELLDALAEALTALGPLRGSVLSVAMPGPFDYERGIGRFHDVGKFDALDGIDVGAGLLPRLPTRPSRIAFLNDAAAFGLGEWVAGAARGCARAVAITLGTGVGSSFVEAGRLVTDDARVPPDGHIHRATLRGQPLEDLVSRRAIEARWREQAAATGDIPPATVRRIFDLARGGHAGAGGVLHGAFVDLGLALRPWLLAFGPSLLVVGGGLTGAWDLIEGPLYEGLGAELAELPIAVSPDADASASIGAAWYAGGATDA